MAGQQAVSALQLRPDWGAAAEDVDRLRQSKNHRQWPVWCVQAEKTIIVGI